MKFFLISYMVSLCLVESQGRTSCRDCKPGFYALRQCNDEHDTVCSPCPAGSYRTLASVHDQCTSCSVCGENSFPLKQCSPTEDTECASCNESSYSHLQSFKEACNHREDDKGLATSHHDTKTLDLGEGSGEGDVVLLPDPKPTQTLVIIDNSDLTNNDTLSEGSGGYAVEIEPSTDDLSDDNSTLTDPPPTNTTLITDTTTTEATTKSQSDTESTTTSQSDTTTHQHHQTVTSRVPTYQSTTEAPTSSTKTATPSSKPTASSSKTTTSSSKTTTSSTTSSTLSTTTVKTGIIVPDEGIIISPPKDDDEDDDTGIIIYPDKPTKGPIVINDQEDFGGTLAPNVNAAAQRTSNDADNGTVTVGVLIAAVLAVAFVFFFIGFLVAKCFRRGRSGTFKVMEEMERNGASKNAAGAGVGLLAEKKQEPEVYETGTASSPVIQKSPENDVITPKTVEDIYAVPDKTKKRESYKKESELDKIKFIDETTDEELEPKEGDRLIEDGNTENRGSQASIPNGKVRHSSEMEDDVTQSAHSEPHSPSKVSEPEDDSNAIISNAEMEHLLSGDRVLKEQGKASGEKHN